MALTPDQSALMLIIIVIKYQLINVISYQSQLSMSIALSCSTHARLP